MGAELSQWFRKYEETARGFVRGRLTPYPSLRGGFAGWLAEVGVARAGEIAEFLRRFDVEFRGKVVCYFADEFAFSRWLVVAGHREALRFALSVEPVQTCLHQLPAEQRIVLQLRYVDQFSDEEVARVRRIPLARRPFFDAPAARTRSLEAYKALCDLLQKRHPPPGDTPRGRYRDYSTVFPLFPGLTLAELRTPPRGEES
jgi:hypothetical protein